MEAFEVYYKLKLEQEKSNFNILLRIIYSTLTGSP